jgi:hypothetical protein
MNLTVNFRGKRYCSYLKMCIDNFPAMFGCNGWRMVHTRTFYTLPDGDGYEIVADERDGNRFLVFDGITKQTTALELCQRLNDCIEFWRERQDDDE